MEDCLNLAHHELIFWSLWSLIVIGRFVGFSKAQSLLLSIFFKCLWDLWYRHWLLCFNDYLCKDFVLKVLELKVHLIQILLIKVHSIFFKVQISFLISLSCDLFVMNIKYTVIESSLLETLFLWRGKRNYPVSWKFCSFNV